VTRRADPSPSSPTARRWATKSPAAADKLHDLYAAASRPGSTEAAEKEVAAALLDDLDVSKALSVATEAGGSAGRLLIRVLSLG